MSGARLALGHDPDAPTGRFCTASRAFSCGTLLATMGLMPIIDETVPPKTTQRAKVYAFASRRFAISSPRANNVPSATESSLLVPYQTLAADQANHTSSARVDTLAQLSMRSADMERKSSSVRYVNFAAKRGALSDSRSATDKPSADPASAPDPVLATMLEGLKEIERLRAALSRLLFAAESRRYGAAGLRAMIYQECSAALGLIDDNGEPLSMLTVRSEADDLHAIPPPLPGRAAPRLLTGPVAPALPLSGTSPKAPAARTSTRRS